MLELKITISVPENDQKEVEHLFRNRPAVSTTLEDLFSLSTDAVLIPINSFGFFEGGLPLQATDHFGLHLQESLQKIIVSDYFGELLVGQAEILPSRTASPAHVIAAPLVRTIDDDLTNSMHAYLAMRAALLAIRNNPDKEITSLGVPLIGTGRGGLTAYTSARQIRYAIRGILREKPRKLEHLSKLKRRENSLKRKKPKNRELF
jgi:O-acetyl-ADP-ribose deacetylase (regulator of RNase III)